MSQHVEGMWCANLHCRRCYSYDVWQKAEVTRLRLALRDVMKASEYRMYEACPDCDDGCSKDRRCRIAPLDRAGEIARDALDPPLIALHGQEDKHG